MHSGYVHFNTEERKPMQVKTEAYKVKKSFKLGEMIRII